MAKCYVMTGYKGCHLCLACFGHLIMCILEASKVWSLPPPRGFVPLPLQKDAYVDMVFMTKYYCSLRSFSTLYSKLYWIPSSAPGCRGLEEWHCLSLHAPYGQARGWGKGQKVVALCTQTTTLCLYWHQMAAKWNNIMVNVKIYSDPCTLTWLKVGPQTRWFTCRVI